MGSHTHPQIHFPVGHSKIRQSHQRSRRQNNYFFTGNFSLWNNLAPWKMAPSRADLSQVSRSKALHKAIIANVETLSTLRTGRRVMFRDRNYIQATNDQQQTLSETLEDASVFTAPGHL